MTEASDDALVIVGEVGTDPAKEQNGVWVPWIVNPLNDRPIELLIARAGGSNKAYTLAMQERSRPYQKSAAAGALDPEIAVRLQTEVFADTVLLGWRNMTTASGREVEFTPQAGLGAMRGTREMFEFVQGVANTYVSFRLARREATQGN